MLSTHEYSIIEVSHVTLASLRFLGRNLTFLDIPCWLRFCLIKEMEWGYFDEQVAGLFCGCKIRQKYDQLWLNFFHSLIFNHLEHPLLHGNYQTLVSLSVFVQVLENYCVPGTGPKSRGVLLRLIEFHIRFRKWFTRRPCFSLCKYNLD